jgi:hypothetical protein
MSKISDPEHVNNICVANVSDQAATLNIEVFMKDWEFSDI